MTPAKTRITATTTRGAARLRIVHRDVAATGQLVEIEALAREAGIHPDLVRRLIALGLLEPERVTSAPVFPRDAAAKLARAVRLRRDLGLNYAGAVLACELLARIEALEERLARYERER